jgi:hypothetical protein
MGIGEGSGILKATQADQQNVRLVFNSHNSIHSRMTEATTTGVLVISFTGSRRGFMPIIASMTHCTNHRRKGEQHTDESNGNGLKECH